MVVIPLKWILMPPHPLTNFEIKIYQNEPRFNGVYSRDNLSEIKDGAYVINLNEYSDIGTHFFFFFLYIKILIYNITH